MLQSISTALGQFAAVFKRLSPAKQVGVAAALLVVIGGFVALMILAGRPEFKVLFSNLSQQDAAEVVEKLKELRVPYQLAANGTAVTVPADKLYDTRLALAGEGLPKGGGVGFEIFDETKIGATEFMQRINYQRALQGELARTINQFDEVVSSRVHIVVPQDSLFIEQAKQPSAAVVLQLKGSARLNPAKVQAVVNLVAGAVEGLEAGNVTVVDTAGRVLYDKKDESRVAGLTEAQSDHQRQVETTLAEKVQSLLDRVVGAGRSIAKVSAVIDFSQHKEVQESYDPDSAVIRSSQATEENQVGQGTKAQGSPDEQFKVTGQTGAGGGGERNQYTRTSETINYEINKINRQVVKQPGDLKRLSVAVLIDGRYEEKTGPDGKPARTYQARSPEELAQFAALIRSAVGFDEKRGDVVQVSSMAFEAAPLVGPEKRGIVEILLDYASRYARTAVVVILAFLFFLMIVRPMVRWSGRELKEALVEAKKLPAPGGEEAIGELEDLRRKMGPKDKAAWLAQREPDLAVEVVRSWLHESAPSK